MIARLSFLAFSAALTLPAVHAAPVCTVIADAADGHIVFQQGTQADCARRYTPASTFKLPIALMGADAGILQGPHAPVWNYEAGFPAWGGEAWRQAADPARWIQYSIVWYSQQTAKKLGQAAFQRYTSAFQYGNADVSGEPGKNNGLDGAWIMSSLRISPLEQIGFLRRYVNRQLPVKTEAYALAESIFGAGEADGWQMYGKTGTGSPGENGVYKPEHAYGWFVGWARKDGRQLVFARLIQDEQVTKPNAGLRAREELLSSWASWVGLR